MASIIKTENVNTNNPWGFGGWSGTRSFYSNGFVQENGRAYYRHFPSSKRNHNYFTLNGESVWSINCNEETTTVFRFGKVSECPCYVGANSKKEAMDIFNTIKSRPSEYDYDSVKKIDVTDILLKNYKKVTL